MTLTQFTQYPPPFTLHTLITLTTAGVI